MITIIAFLYALFVALASTSQSISFTLNTSQVINSTASNYRGVNMDWHLPSEEIPAWGNASILNADLENPLFVTLAKNLAPAIFRVGGSEGDSVIYIVGNNPPPCTEFCLNMTRWAQINSFAKTVGFNLVFGLNAMYNRKNASDPWDPSNAIAFLEYTAQQGYNIYGFELGNELTTKVDPKVLGADFVTLSKLLEQFWPNAASRPRLIGPDLNPDTLWLDNFLSVAGPVMDVVTYHLYIGYGLDPQLVDQLQQPSFLDTERTTAIPISTSVGVYAPQAELWVGESAAAWHSGQAGTTNEFISSLWYVDQLGTLATLNHKAFCRQTLTGGFYGLLNYTDLQPTPDYYTALFWNAYMGQGVLSIQGDPSAPDVRVYAQCATQGQGAVSLAIINLSNSTTYTISLSSTPTVPRTEWHVTAPSLLSTAYYVNGAQLLTNPDGTVPEWPNAHVDDPDKPIYIEPLAIQFLVLSGSKATACV